MKKKIWIGIGILVFGVIGYFGYQFYQFAEFLDELGDCGFSVGPYEGQELKIDLDTVTVDEFLEYPNGRFAFLSTQDSLTPIMIKLNKHDSIIWAIKLNSSDSANWIPMNGMTDIRLNKESEVKSIFFFNSSFSEPGTIYLTENYDFKYMCLSPM